MSGGGESRGGRYATYAEIASGGMATVHLGQLVGARGFARTVAIKVLHASYAKNKEFVERFIDEARLVGRIHHPNVMPTLDVIAEGDQLRIVMDYVAGESLDRISGKLLIEDQRMPLRIACAIMSGVLHGLHAAHEAKNEFGEPLGIVHLDVSPQNILVGTDGVARVLDFGVARARGNKVEGQGGGKSAYLAPEQVRGAEVTPRTDVFAASIVLWELVTGESLFAADNHAATMQRVLGGVIPAASDKLPEVPQRLDELLKIGLRRDPSQRFATARDMALELEQAVAPALASEVGSWVAGVAEATLVARAGKVREMEAQAASSSRPPAPVPAPAEAHGKLPGLVSPRAMYEEQAAVNLPSEDLVDDFSRSLLRPPGGEDSVPQRAADGSVQWKPRGALQIKTRAASSGPLPSRTAKKAPAASKKRDPRILWIGLGVALVALALVAVGVRALVLPGYVASTAIVEAAAHGVTLTVGEASLSDDGVVLRTLTAKLAGVPQATCTIASADVRAIWSSPAHVVLGKTEIVVDGDARGVLDAILAWSAAHRGRTRADDENVGGIIDMPTAHLVWTHATPGPASEVTRIEATGLSGGIGSPTAASLGDDAHLLTNALVLETKMGTFGPWNLSVDATIKETRARVAFDPAVPDGPNALLVVDALGHSSFDVNVPRVAPASLGVPRTALGPDLPFPQQLELTAHYGRLNRDQGSGSLRAALYGVHIAELGNAVDAQLSGEIAGPSAGVQTVKNGVFSLGPLRGVVTGTVAPEARSLRGNLAWKADPVPCATLAALPTPVGAAADLTKKAVTGDLGDLGDLARDLGAIGGAVGAVKVTGTFAASGTVSFLASDLAHPKWTTATKNACGLALFGGQAK